MEIASENILKFGNARRLAVNGTLIADAEVDEYIYFTSFKDDNWGGDTNSDASGTAPGYNDWYGIQFHASSNDAECIMNRCNVRYAGYNYTGAVSMTNANPTVTNCELSNSYYGVMMREDSNPTFSYNTIGSSQVVPVAMSYEADPIFIDNSFSFSDNEYDAIGLLGGTLTANANLIQRSFTTTENVTYLLLGGVFIPEGLSLTIEPGIVIKGYSSSQHYFIVGGALISDATEADPIVFTSVKDDNHGNPLDTNKDGTISAPALGDWGGFFFEPGVDGTTIIDNSLIRYPNTYDYNYHGENATGHAMVLVNASPTITNCEISNVNYGVTCFQASNPILENNSIVNSNYTPFAISASANPTFSGNTFINPGWNALGLLGGYVSVSGTIFSREVGGYENITYILLDDLFINDGAEINVEAGVVIKFTNSYVSVNGGFRTDGAPGNEVIITSILDDNYGNPLDTNGDGNGSAPAAGNWRYIVFEDTSDDDYCVIDYSEFYYGGATNAGILAYNSAGGTVSNSLLGSSSSYGLYINGSSAPEITNVTIENCESDPIAMSLKADPTFTDVTFAANGSNGIRIIEGTLSSDATLAQRSVAGIDNIAYIVLDLIIAPDAILTLEPGVVIKFPAYYYEIRIQGGLIAEGTAEEKITFTSLSDDSAGGDTNNDGNGSSPSWGQWGGLFFADSSMDDVNSIDYCEIRYGGSTYHAYGSGNHYGIIRFVNCYVHVRNSVLQQSYSHAFGIYGSANPLIEDNEIYTIQNEPVFMSMFAEPVFAGNTALNVGHMAINIKPENWSQTATVPQRNFAGYNNITYYLSTGSISINSGTTITIPAGTVFKKYSSHGQFNIYGDIQLLGTEFNPVIFTDYRDDEYGNPLDSNQDGFGSSPDVSNGAWFNFDDVSDDTSLLQYGLLRYRDWGVSCSSASPTLDYLTITNGNNGVALNGVSEPNISNCVFDDLSYVPLNISLVSYPATATNNIISGSTYKAIGIKVETLAQNVTLSSREFGGVTNIPYVFSTYTVGTGATLTIDPGVVCKFYNNGYINVQKGLLAQGGESAAEKIVFTSISDDFYGGDSNSDGSATAPYSYIWRGIRFESQSLDPFCQIDHSIFRYAGHSASGGMGGITAYSANPTIQNSAFNRCYYGLVAHDASNPSINYCDFDQIDIMAVYNVDQSFIIDAENNWWGDNSGPTHWENPTGIGEEVSDAVDYDPWNGDGAGNPLMGDVSLNGDIQAFDASLVLQYSVDLIPLDPIQQLVADVSGDGPGGDPITAFDASLILQYVVGMITVFPAEEIARNDLSHQLADVIFDVGSVQSSAGAVFSVPLSLENAIGIKALQLEINYDTDLFTLTGWDKTGITSELTYADNLEQAGKVLISMAGTDSIDEDGVVAFLHFKAADDLQGVVQSQIIVDHFVADEYDLTAAAKSGEITITGTPTVFALHQNYPNPFNPSTTITYELPENSKIMVDVLNLLGQTVTTLTSGRQDAGVYSVMWDGLNQAGNEVPSGTYLVRMQAGEYNQTIKIMMVK